MSFREGHRQLDPDSAANLNEEFLSRFPIAQEAPAGQNETNRSKGKIQIPTDSETIERTYHLGEHEKEKLEDPSQEQILQVVNYFTKHPEAVPPRVKIEFLRDMVVDSTNNATIRLQSEIHQLEQEDPSQAYVTKIFVEAWLIAHGFRMVEDQMVSASIRQDRAAQDEKKSKGWFKKVALAVAGVDEHSQTEIIERNLALAAINAGLEQEKLKLEGQNKALGEKHQQILENAAKSAADIIEKANIRAKEIVEQSQLESEEIKRAAQLTLKQAQDKSAESELKVQTASREIEKSNDKINRLNIEIAKLEAIKASLLADPKIYEIHRSLNKENKEDLEISIKQGIISIFELSKELVRYEIHNDKSDLGVYEKLKKLYKESSNILHSINDFEKEFSKEKRALFFKTLFYEQKLNSNTVHDALIVPERHNYSYYHASFPLKWVISFDNIMVQISKLSDEETDVYYMMTKFDENTKTITEFFDSLPSTSSEDINVYSKDYITKNLVPKLK